jgi:thiol-disulfide isomerase/thioredoxin
VIWWTIRILAAKSKKMFRRIAVISGMICIGIIAKAQPVLPVGVWRGELERKDGIRIPFHFDTKTENNKTVLYVINASEKLKVTNIKSVKDSVFIEFPVFESYFKLKKKADGDLEGVWIKGGSVNWQIMPFYARLQSKIPAQTLPPVSTDITGRWSLTFTKADATGRPAIGEWQQKGQTLAGTILTPTGDYRYLTGFLNGDSLQLSTFDGAHAFLFKAKLNGAEKVESGVFYSGFTSSEPWLAVKDANASLPDVAAAYMKDPEEKLRFRFKDLQGKMVSLDDARFRNKVVVVQIMGSWCPNCMDETAFLSDFYKKNKSRGVEIIALAYEYSTDPVRSVNSIQKFKKRFGVEYTMLNTGVTVSDSLRTEKTLPQITMIKSFPTTIFVDKKGRVAKIRAGFEGPGTGQHYEALKQDFSATIDELLKSK